MTRTDLFETRGTAGGELEAQLLDGKKEARILRLRI
jgi:hypothetical protein